MSYEKKCLKEEEIKRLKKRVSKLMKDLDEEKESNLEKMRIILSMRGRLRKHEPLELY